MPAFTFEKISPSREHARSAQPQPKPQSASPQRRDNVIQVLGRFVIARVREDRASLDQHSSN
ncbi:MAG: hypothetical protein CFE29_26875 [Bradyrhizobiaceae bacterium PARB1]|jgi:hypothetical protein|nr:MAG: hypothetical protein CFE29_26875 [Bradyrhizobiaceae bacterium PARB1]